MPRKPKSNVAAVETLTLRLTSADRALLDRLVAKRRAKLAEMGAEEADVTAASLVRALIRREAKAEGITTAPPVPSGAPPPSAAPVALEATAPRRPKGKRPPRSAEATTTEVHAALLRCIEGGLSAREIARRAKVDPGSISRFKSSGAGISQAKLQDLARVLS